MRRQATPSLEALDPDVLAAARDVAARAGIPVESWIASVIPAEGRRSGEAKAAPRRRQTPPVPTPAAQTPSAPAPAAPEQAPLDGILDALLQRLDTIDRTIAEERESAKESAARRIETLEARISDVLDSSAAPARHVADRLGEIERRMSELGEQFAASRPPGRRGRAAVEEIRGAVEEIRQRRREIEGDEKPAQETRPLATHDPVAAMRADLARRLDAVAHDEARPSSSAAIAELRQEIGRLRDSVGSLATGQHVGALEQAMLTLAGDVRRAQQPADLAAIAAPIEAIRAQVDRLAGDVSDNVYERVAGEFERVAKRIDSALASGPGAATDSEAVSGLFKELEEIRHVTAALAGPERIQGLVQAVQALSGQIEGLRASFGPPDAGIAQLRPLLEEIRSGLDARRPPDVSEHFKSIAERLDALQGATAGIDPAQSRAILGRIDALSDKVDRVGIESLRQPAAPSAELASIQSMLRSLADKVDTVGRRSGGGEGLDALEKQVLAIANRLDARGSDPALAGLERTMGDLMRQVSALRDEAATVTAVERAARSAVADTIGETPELGLLRAGLADLQSRQSASEDRLHATLEGVRSAIDRLVLRSNEQPGEAPAPSLDERLLSSTGLQPPRARAGQRPDAPRAPAALAEAGRMTDELLEPGAGRPPRGRIAAPSQDADAVEGAGDIKSSFIAAARRAAQAAHAEDAAEAAEAAEAAARTERPRNARKGLALDLPEPVAPARSMGLRATIEKRRKPLLLGLAAVVLILGALQALTMSVDPAPAPKAPVAEARSAPIAAEPERAAPVDPQTTQAIGERPQAKAPASAAPAPAAAKSTVPQVSNMQALAGDLAGLPAGLATLKQSVLDGDGAAIYELAVREADGRGMPRDLAVSAKLYEKLASAGYAPAQYRLAGQYEKGSGLIRDLSQAKLWYGRAAEQGHARSMHNLAVIYAENPGPSGKPDFASAGSWFRQAAEYGVRDSQYNLAVLYARGLGVGQDLVQSYAWFSAAATQGDTEAGKKRDDVAGKLSPDDLAKAKTIVANFKPRKADPAVNEAPLPKDAAPQAMSLLGAPAPSAPTSAFVSQAKR